MPNVDRECVTHHYACDCREEAFAQTLRAAIAVIEAWNISDFCQQLRAIGLLRREIEKWKENPP